MTLLSVLFPGDLLLSRTFYGYDAAPLLIVAPVKANIVRVSMVGAGARIAGAAFARTKTACTPSESFSLVIGRRPDAAADPGGDSTFTRVTGSVLLCRAKGATSGAHGLASGCVGDTKRSGTTSIYNHIGGDCGGDDADPYPLGFGGSGAYDVGIPGNPNRYAYPGAGGTFDITYGSSGGVPLKNTIKPGDGRACVEFFIADPGYA